jgi:two-component system cell cycle sensor histidine kinase/response regulator CckA
MVHLNALQLLHVFCVVIYLYLAGYIIARGYKVLLNQACGIVFLVFGLWSFSLIFVHDPSASRETARFFYGLGSLAWCSFASFALWFIVVFADDRKILRSKLFYTALVLPPILNIWKQWKGDMGGDLVGQSWGWGYTWNGTFWDYFFWGYYLTYMGGVLWLLTRQIIRPYSQRRRKQAIIIFGSALVSLILSTMTDVVLPALKIHSIPNIAPDFTLFWAIGLVVAVRRYRMLDITPSLAADNILEAMSDALIMTNNEGQTIRMNRAARMLFACEERELAGEGIDILMPEHLRGRQMEPIWRHRDVTGFDYIMAAMNGLEIPVLFSSSVIRGDAGDVIGCVCIARDMTERRQTEEMIRKYSEQLEAANKELEMRGKDVENALQESEDIFRHFMEKSPIYIFFKDDKDRALRLSRNFEDMLGKPVKDMLGKTMEELFPSDIAKAMVADDLKILAEGKTVSIEEELNGRIYTTVKFPIPIEGKPRYLAGYTIDITERRIAEERAMANSRQIEAMFEQATSGIAMVHLDGRWLRVNRRLCEIVGYAEEELLKVRFADITHPDDVQADNEARMKLRAGETSSYLREKRYIRKDGDIVWVHISVGIVRNKVGQPEYFVTVVEDITSRIMAEHKQKELEAQLQQAQKMDAVGKLAGGVAHDFNNVLTVIGGYTEILLGETPANAPAYGKLKAISKGVDQASALTHQLLAFSRRQVLQPRELDFNKVIAGMRPMLARLIGEDVTMEFRPGEGLGRVRVDPGQIGQVIMNLAVNARDAMPDGGRLIMETFDVELDKAYADSHVSVVPGSYVCLAVTDTGMGMDAATQERIFEPFFTTKGEGKGTGLGLSMVYGIVKQSGGSIWVYSEPGKGTTFKIHLPRIGRNEEAVEEPVVRISGLQGSETILVVEDQGDIRELIRVALGTRGYRVLEAPNGREALALFEREPEAVNLILTDLVMPEMGGKELAETVRGKNLTVKVLYMSGYTERATFQQTILQKGETFIQKPFGLEALAKKVREALDSA